MTAEVIAIRSDDAACRAAAMARHPAGKAIGTCPPHAALLHRLASLITTAELPPAHVSVNGTDVLIDLTGTELVENGVRRWAVAIDRDVTEVRTETGTLWSASGYDGSNVWWHVTGVVRVTA